MEKSTNGELTKMSDDWDDGDDDKDMRCKEWSRVENGLEKTGYREGLESSQENRMQEGFDHGFKQAMAMAFEAGRLQGGICASMSFNSVAFGQSSNKSSDTLENHNNDISSLVSEIPDVLSSKGVGNSETISFSPESSEFSNVTTSAVNGYWSRLKTFQSMAEKEDKHLDSSFISHD